MSTKKPKSWEAYEALAARVLRDAREVLGLSHVEGKQSVTGAATSWEIDIVGYDAETGGLVLVECKRFGTARISQETVGGLAYRVHDTGAVRGVFVTTEGFQKGAALVAGKEGISRVVLDPDADPENYTARIGDLLFVVVTAKNAVSVRPEISAHLVQTLEAVVRVDVAITAEVEVSEVTTGADGDAPEQPAS